MMGSRVQRDFRTGKRLDRKAENQMYLDLRGVDAGDWDVMPFSRLDSLTGAGYGRWVKDGSYELTPAGKEALENLRVALRE